MTHRVLVADSTTVQKVIKIAFAKHDVEIVEAASFVEALAAVTRVRPDVLVLNAALTGARGPEDFRRLVTQAGDVPILLLAGSYDGVDETAFRTQGFLHFMKKPFESGDIVAIVDQLLGGALATREPASAPGRATLTPPGRAQHTTVIARPGTYYPSAPEAPAVTQPPEDTRATEMLPQDGDDEGDERLPPPPLTDERRRGRRAFALDEETLGRGGDPSASGALPPPPLPEVTDPRRSPAAAARKDAGGGLPPVPASSPFSPGSLPVEAPIARRDVIDAAMLQAFLEERLPGEVRRAVEDYCERHFKSLAREVVTAELRRLADERARHLVDG